MKNLLIGLLASLCFCVAAYGQTTPGMFYGAGAKYELTILRSHPQGWGAKFFTQKELFGDALPVVTKLLLRGQASTIALNLRWSDTHTFSRRDFPAIIAEAKRFKPLIQTRSQIKWYVSGATEHNLNAKDAQDLANQVLAVLPPWVTYVNNPWVGKGAFIPATDRIVNEVHGSGAQPPGGRYTFDLDGSSAVDVDIEKIKATHAGAEVFWYWVPQYNLRKNSNDPTPRNQRKAEPTGELIQSVAFLRTSRGPVSIPKGWLLKTHADQHSAPVPEPRALKPVLIAPGIKEPCNMSASNGTVIRVSEIPQPFADGRMRVYFPAFGFRLAEKAISISGSPTVKIDCVVGYATKAVKGKNTRVKVWKSAQVNPGFRAGDFR